MRYQFKFSPRFLNHKREILGLAFTPEILLPREVEACLNSEESIERGVKAKGASPLWMASWKAVQPLLFKSAGISIFTALCASSATISAIQILKTKEDHTILKFLALAYFLASVLMQVGTFFNNRIRNVASHTLHALLIQLISQKLLRLSARAEARQSSGNLKVLITSDTQKIAEFVDNFVRNFIPALVALVVVMPLLFKLTGKAGLAGVLIMTAFLPLAFGLNFMNKYFQNRGQWALDALTSLLGEWIKNIRLVRYLSWDHSFQQDIALKLRKYMNFSIAQHILGCVIFGLSSSWWMVSSIGVYAVIQRQQPSFDLLGSFGTLWLLTFLAGYFTHIPNTIRLLGQASPSMNRIALLLAEEEQQDLFQSKMKDSISFNPPFEAKPVRVIFENVSFSYDPNPHEIGKIILKNISVTVSFNCKLAIVGEVGCGKTTFLKLLCGEFPPTHGQILVEFEDGTLQNLWNEPCHIAYRKHLAWVPQEPFVSSDPLSLNISLISSVEESALVEAAYWAELEADLLAFPNGIHEEIGEGGVNLSGGQKQRLNMARAYYSTHYSNRSYLILDDALSAVDSSTEMALMKRLESHGNGFMLVTHRTDELMRVEKVWVMKNGTFIESGTPQTLGNNPATHFSRVLKAYERTHERIDERGHEVAQEIKRSDD